MEKAEGLFGYKLMPLYEKLESVGSSQPLIEVLEMMQLNNLRHYQTQISIKANINSAMVFF